MLPKWSKTLLRDNVQGALHNSETWGDHQSSSSITCKSFAFESLMPQAIPSRHHSHTTFARVTVCQHIKSCKACSSAPPEATNAFPPQFLQVLQEASLFIATAGLFFHRGPSVHDIKCSHMIVFDLQAVQ